MPNNPATGQPGGLLRRAAAFLIDIGLLYLYIILLVALSMAVDRIFPLHELMAGSYALRHLVGFTTLTLPLLLYFILMERSRQQATLGKRVMNLRVISEDGRRASTQKLIVRNLLKFLPWELAHLHAHLNPDFLFTGQTTVAGWALGAALPILAIWVYAGMIALRPDHRSLYELATGTQTVRRFAEAAPVKR